MSDREPGSGVAVWIALRRAHQGEVANLAGYWLDSGRPVPSYVADALEELTRGGLLTLGEEDPRSGGVRRITVTDTGSAHYVALCQIHNLHRWPVVSTPRRWAHSPHDQRSHLLAKRGADQIGVQIGVCGRRMRWSVPTSNQPTGPRCPTCQALALPAPRFGTSPDSGRAPAEQLRPPLLAPGSRSDTITPMDPQHDAQFPTKTPAGRRSSRPVPAPGGQPDTNHRAGGSSAGPLRWERCPDQGHLHLLTPTDVVASAGGNAQALCGQWLASEGLTLTSSAGAPRLACVAGIPATSTDPHPRTGSASSPAGPGLAGGDVRG